MYRRIGFYFALGALPVCLACDKQGAAAQAAAEKADAAPSEFEKVRENYRHQQQTDLALVDKTITDLEAKEKAVAGKTKTDLQEKLSSLKAERDAFVSDLRATDGIVASMWDVRKAHLDKEWVDLKTSSEKATSMVAAENGAIHKPGELTCEDFIALDEVVKPKVVYWAEGFNKSGKPVDSVLDIDQTDRLVPVLVAECTKNPKAALSKVVDRHVVTRPAATAAPAPARMTCEQFVALENVAQPKIVYWAEGFNIKTDGGATDAVVDIAETDRLVPVLVSECKETPKLTLWQEIKKYF